MLWDAPGLSVCCSQRSVRPEKEEQPVQNPHRSVKAGWGAGVGCMDRGPQGLRVWRARLWPSWGPCPSPHPHEQAPYQAEPVQRRQGLPGNGWLTCVGGVAGYMVGRRPSWRPSQVSGTLTTGEMQVISRPAFRPTPSVSHVSSLSPLPSTPTPQDRKRRNLSMEKPYNKNEGNLENEGKPEDEVEPDDEEKPDVEGKTECEGKREDKGEPGDEGQLEDEGSQEKQGQSEGEGKPQGEDKPASQAKPESQPRAAEKRPAEDYVPRKAKRKTDRGTDDSPKDSQEDIQGRRLSSEEMMRECGDVSRAQAELRKKQKMGGFHWMQRDVQDSFAPRGQRGVRGMRGGGRGQRGLHDISYL
uniref:Transcription elongation factor A protein-like 3 n=2 Tax=Callithrix jacchus TaxID=9483 RepID=A0A8I3WDY5_CALJA